MSTQPALSNISRNCEMLDSRCGTYRAFLQRHAANVTVTHHDFYSELSTLVITTSSVGEQLWCFKYSTPTMCKAAWCVSLVVCDLYLMTPRMNAMCQDRDVCLWAWVREGVCVSLDKTVNPQATRTQYPVCPFLISCLTLAEREAAGRGWRGTTGPGRYLRNRRYSRLIWGKVYANLPISPSLMQPPILTLFLPSLSAFIISDLIKQRRAACSAMKHLLAVCYKIVVGEERWRGLISDYAKLVAILPPHIHTMTFQIKTNSCAWLCLP